MHGERGASLLRELSKSRWVPPYDGDGVRSVISEIRALLEELVDTVTKHGSSFRTDPGAASGAVVYHRAIERNKRCVLAYLHERMRRLVAHRWEYGAGSATALHDALSGTEATALNAYEKALGKYCATVQLDLTADQKPPRDLYIEVRVLRDCGDLMTDHGAVALRKGTAHFLRRVDVEHLVRQGALEHVV